MGHLVAGLGGPVTIGDVELEVSTFQSFGFAYGDVEELAWSPDGRFVAYTLGSARAGGDGLHVDDLKERLRLLEFDAHAAPATDAGASLGAVVDGFGWFPGFRDLVWHDDGLLTFVSHDPSLGFEEGEVRWRFDRARGEPTVD